MSFRLPELGREALSPVWDTCHLSGMVYRNKCSIRINRERSEALLSGWPLRANLF